MTWKITIEHIDDSTKEACTTAVVITDSEVNHSYGDILGYYFKRELALLIDELKANKS